MWNGSKKYKVYFFSSSNYYVSLLGIPKVKEVMERRKQVLLDLHPDKANLNKITDKQKEKAEERLKRSIISFKYIKDYLIKKKLDVSVDEEKDEWEEYIVIEELDKYHEKVWKDHTKVWYNQF